MIVDECGLCGRQNYNILLNLELPDIEMPFKRGLNLVKCRQCGLVYIIPRPTVAETRQLYQPEYFKKFYLEKNQLKAGFFRQMIGRIKLFKNKGRLLDIGCGTGDFLQLAVRSGWSVTGLEIAPFAAEFNRTELKLDVRLGALTEQCFPDASFDIVTMWDVLEHEPQPKQTLSEIHRILNPGGLLVLKVPNLDSPINRALLFYSRLKKINLVHAPTHLFHFTPATLKKMVRLCGFSVKKLWLADDPVEWRFASILKAFLFRWLMIISRCLNLKDSMVLVVLKK